MDPVRRNTVWLVAGCVLLLAPFSGLAGGENNQWCFGIRTGLDFNVLPPVFFEHRMQVMEGAASVSDQAGNLLFYSSGFAVWDRNGNRMPNGTGLQGNGPVISGTGKGSSQNGVAIVQDPGRQSRYRHATARVR